LPIIKTNDFSNLYSDVRISLSTRDDHHTNKTDEDIAKAKEKLI